MYQLPHVVDSIIVGLQTADEWKMTVLVAGLAAGGVVIVIFAAVIVMCW